MGNQFDVFQNRIRVLSGRAPAEVHQVRALEGRGRWETFHPRCPSAVCVIPGVMEVQSTPVPEVEVVKPLKECKGTGLRGSGKGGGWLGVWEEVKVDRAWKVPREVCQGLLQVDNDLIVGNP